MGDIISKISSYNIFTNLIPGAVFAFGAQRLDIYDFQSPSTVIDIVMYYFLGVVISRIGSIILQPILEVFHIVNKGDYSKFIIAEAKDQKILILIESNNLYRSMLSVQFTIIILYVIKVISGSYGWSLRSIEVGTVVFLLILFILSYRKQSSFIEKRIQHHNKGE